MVLAQLAHYLFDRFEFASASRKIIGTWFGKLKLEGLEWVGDPEELAELLPGGV